MGSELTTSSLRLVPQKLLPFGGNTRFHACGRIKTHDGWHDKLRQASAAAWRRGVRNAPELARISAGSRRGLRNVMLSIR